MNDPRPRRRAVILTAVGVETNAIRSRVKTRRRTPDASGVVLYENGVLELGPVTWEVTLIETGQDNEPAAVLTERGRADTHPDVLIYFGIAGRLKDATHGDIVVATGAHTYQRGKDTKDGFQSRPDPLPTSERFAWIARHLRDDHSWWKRIRQKFRDPPPRVHVGPVASGAEILEDPDSKSVALIKNRYNDAVAIEKESIGFLTAVRLGDIDGCVVRVISDALSDKQQADRAGGQVRAAERGAAFVVACLEAYGRFFVRGDEPAQFAPDVRAIRAAVDQTTTQVRATLKPYLLPAISRPVVRDVLLPAVVNSQRASPKRVVPIIAPAGYGKSTVLGQLYDELQSSDDLDACLLRCDDVPAGPDAERELAGVLGQAATGLPSDLRLVVSALAKPGQHQVVLIDTLDQLLSQALLPPLRRLLSELTGRLVTVVFTCRDYDYQLYLEPPGQSLPGVEVDRHTLLPFDKDEIESAARGFLRQLDPPIAEPAIDEFLRRLIDLAVDRRPVFDLLACPLLLALLCESHGRDQVLPADLSVTRLYDTHWDRKVARGRGVEPVGRRHARERYALALAEACFDASVERLQDTVEISDLAPKDGLMPDVVEDLFSANIFQQPRSGRVRFFHQTFLEYAVARWLGTVSQRSRMLQLLEELREGDRSHWWPTVRQLVARCNSAAEVAEILSSLDIGALPAFRAATFGVCARSDGAELERLAERADQQGEEFQVTLLEALSGVPAQLRHRAWMIAMRFRHSMRDRVRNAVMETLGVLLGQSSPDQRRLLDDLFNAKTVKEEQ